MTIRNIANEQRQPLPNNAVRTQYMTTDELAQYCANLLPQSKCVGNTISWERNVKPGQI
jgi:hypothetical protein